MLKVMQANATFARILWEGPGSQAWQAMNAVGINRNNGWKVFTYGSPDQKFFTCINHKKLRDVFLEHDNDLLGVSPSGVDSVTISTRKPVGGKLLGVIQETLFVAAVTGSKTRIGDRDKCFYLELSFEPLARHESGLTAQGE